MRVADGDPADAQHVVEELAELEGLRADAQDLGAPREQVPVLVAHRRDAAPRGRDDVLVLAGAEELEEALGERAGLGGGARRWTAAGRSRSAPPGRRPRSRAARGPGASRPPRPGRADPRSRGRRGRPWARPHCSLRRGRLAPLGCRAGQGRPERFTGARNRWAFPTTRRRGMDFAFRDYEGRDGCEGKASEGRFPYQGEESRDAGQGEEGRDAGRGEEAGADHEGRQAQAGPRAG